MFGIFTWINFFGVSAWFVIVQGRNLGGKHDPGQWIIPVELKDLSISKEPGQKLSYQGYEFEVPWNDLDVKKTKLIKSWQMISFHSGKAIGFYPKGPIDLMNGIDSPTLKRFYGAENVKSEYAFTRAMLDTTPGQIGLLTPRREAMRTIILSLMKSICVTAYDGQSGVFPIQTKEFRGFQYGTPASNQYRIQADLFRDGVHLHFVFLHKKGTGDISQAEINRIIQSVRPVSEQPSSTGN